MTFNEDVYAPLKINLQLSFKLMIPSQLVRLSAEPNQVGFFFFFFKYCSKLKTAYLYRNKFLHTGKTYGNISENKERIIQLLSDTISTFVIEISFKV